MLYDGRHWVFVQFRVNDVEHILTTDDVHIIILDVGDHEAVYVLYKMVAIGLNRFIAKRSIPTLNVEGWTRTFCWWNGQPQWNTHDGQPPNGMQRLWSVEYGAWYWASELGEFVAWDTSPLTVNSLRPTFHAQQLAGGSSSAI